MRRPLVGATPHFSACEISAKFHTSDRDISKTPYLIRQYYTNIMSGKGKGGKGGRGGAKKTVSKSAKAGLQFPVARIGRFLKSKSDLRCLEGCCEA